MATGDTPTADDGVGAASAEGTGPPTVLPGVGFDVLFVALSAWFVVGVMLDGNSHAHGGPESFITAEHAVFYTAFLCIAALLGLTAYRRRQRGAAWRDALPTGYNASLLGVAAFAVGGVGDALWHETFGIETDVDALLSPTHLLLFMGGLLFLTGPVRAAWHRRGNGAQSLYAMLTAWGFVLGGFSFLLLYVNPFAYPVIRNPNYVAGFELALGVIGVLVQSALVVGFLLVLFDRWPTALPPGAITLVLGLNVAAIAVVRTHPEFLPGVLVTGLVGDALYRGLDLRRPRHRRAFAAALPLVLFGCYFLTAALTGGIAWTVHAWTGTLFLAGFVGLALGYLAVPPTGGPAPDA